MVSIRYRPRGTFPGVGPPIISIRRVSWSLPELPGGWTSAVALPELQRSSLAQTRSMIPPREWVGV